MKNNNYDNDYTRYDYLLFKCFEVLGYLEGKLRNLKGWILKIKLKKELPF